jgi:hypothetical protein
MSNISKEFCYEYFNCKEYDCIRRKNLAMNCWDIDDVKCKSHSEHFGTLKNRFETKLEACKLCNYYQRSNE